MGQGNQQCKNLASQVFILVNQKLFIDWPLLPALPANSVIKQTKLQQIKSPHILSYTCNLRSFQEWDSLMLQNAVLDCCIYCLA